MEVRKELIKISQETGHSLCTIELLYEELDEDLDRLKKLSGICARTPLPINDELFKILNFFKSE